MTLIQQIAVYAMVLVYVGAGINHFWHPGFYQPIMPPYIPKPDFMIALSGVIEIVLGLALIPDRTRKLAAYAIIAMLVVFLSVHWYMWTERNTKFADVSTWIIAIRLPLQFVLIYWAYYCAMV